MGAEFVHVAAICLSRHPTGKCGNGVPWIGGDQVFYHFTHLPLQAVVGSWTRA